MYSPSSPHCPHTDIPPHLFLCDRIFFSFCARKEELEKLQDRFPHFITPPRGRASPHPHPLYCRNVLRHLDRDLSSIDPQKLPLHPPCKVGFLPANRSPLLPPVDCLFPPFPDIIVHSFHCSATAAAVGRSFPFLPPSAFRSLNHVIFF